MKKLDRKDFDRVYEIMDQSFPRDEIRPYEGQKKLLDIPEYQLFVSEDEDNQINGFLATWDFDEFVFLEHFAVDPNQRNGGVGRRLLREVIESFDKMACLEVELPDCEMSIRRIHFYERNGLFYNEYEYEQPSIATGRYPIPLRVMTSGRGVSEEEFQKIRDILYDRVYHVKKEK